MVSPLIKDRYWVRNAFLVTQEQLNAVDQENRYFTSVSLNFTDTTPGGNLAINPLPQFTRFTDPNALVSLGNRIKSSSQDRYSAYLGSKGMGRYYGEAFDQNQQIIYMRFGVPAFNSMTQFFTGFYNTSAGNLARTGRGTSIFYSIGKAAGFVVSILSWKLLAVHLLGVGLRFAMGKPSSKFYYLKPTMPLYWNAVNSIVNQIAVNRGIVPRIGGAGQSALNNNYEFSKDELNNLHSLLKDVFKKEGGVDVMALATRAQRLAIRRQKIMSQIFEESSNMNLRRSMDDLSKQVQLGMNQQLVDQRPSHADYLSKWFQASQSQPKPTSETPSDSATVESYLSQNSDNTGFGEFLEAELDDGAAFAAFRVNYTGSQNESFSNSVGESELANKINSMSSSSRSTTFDFAGGNLSDNPIAKVVGAAMGAVKDTLAGIADGTVLSGLAALGGAAFVDIPKHWQSATANLARANYTVTLESPYGNPISQLINIYIPLAMLLAGVLPISTGKQSYTSPFILELYDQGRCQTRLGIIDSLSITRGVGNLGFNTQGHAMAIEVNFSVIDLSNIVHMPIVSGFSLDGMQTGISAGSVGGAIAGGAVGGVVGAAGGAVVGGAVGAAGGAASDAVRNVVQSINQIFDEDSLYSDYLAVLSGMSLSEQIYQLKKFKRNLTKTLADWDNWTSAANFASFAGDSIPGRLASTLYKGVVR